MSSFSTGLSALHASQRALDVIGQNIANAGTPGYHRQVVRLATRLPVERAGLSIGTGVQITDVRRLRSGLIEAAFTQHTSELADTTARLDALRRLESVLSGGEGSIHDRLETFFNQLEQLSARPEDTALRRVLLGGAVALTDQFRATAGELTRIRTGLDEEIHVLVDQIGPLAAQIAELNGQIQSSELRGIAANDLRDQRDQLVNDLADLAGIRVIEQDNGQTTVLLGGAALVVGTVAADVVATTDAQGQLVVTLAGSNDPLAISGGTLGGLLQVRNQTLPGFEDRLHALARELMRQIDGAHAQGLGLSGPQTQLAGRRAADSASLPLASAGLAIPAQAGSLWVTVTDLGTGQRTLHEIAIDPQTQSLNNVAAAIGGIPNLTAFVDPQTLTLSLAAAPGYGFDFAGRLLPSPDASGISGTTVPTLGGGYTGTGNDEFTFRVVGSGTIGVTPNLTLEVRNAANTLVATVGIGQGYEPGSELTIADGVTLRLSAGSTNDGDEFSSRMIADADTAGLLPALGLGGFFTGQDAHDIGVRDDLLADPTLLGASGSGQPGDGAIVRRMAAVRDLELLEGGTLTLSEGYVSLVGDVGLEVQALDDRQTGQTLFGERLDAERQSISGVDPNEELVKLVEFQRAFQLASRYINAVNETLDDLFQII